MIEAEREIPVTPVEKKSPSRIELFVTDHSPDFPESEDPENLRRLYSLLKESGVSSIRYDWRWERIEPAQGQFNEEQLERYQKAREIMKEVGLDEPTIILSSVPEWAKDLYRKDKDTFFAAWRKYVIKVSDALSPQAGIVERVQVLNELNNPLYTAVAAEDIPRICRETREVFSSYNPNIKLIGSFYVGNLLPHSTDFLSDEKLLGSFDVILVDYYPAVWHLPLKETVKALKGKPGEIYKQIDLLKKVFKKLSFWAERYDRDYGIGEVGLPTRRLWGEKGDKIKGRAQRYFFDQFFRALRWRIIDDFNKKGLKLPSMIGIYQAVDEPPQGLKGRLLKALPFWPEHDFGIAGDRHGIKSNLILQGRTTGDDQGKGEKGVEPRLKRLVDYLNRGAQEAEIEDIPPIKLVSVVDYDFGYKSQKDLLEREQIELLISIARGLYPAHSLMMEERIMRGIERTGSRGSIMMSADAALKGFLEEVEELEKKGEVLDDAKVAFTTRVFGERLKAETWKEKKILIYPAFSSKWDIIDAVIILENPEEIRRVSYTIRDITNKTGFYEGNQSVNVCYADDFDLFDPELAILAQTTGKDKSLKTESLGLYSEIKKEAKRKGQSVKDYLKSKGARRLYGVELKSINTRKRHRKSDEQV